MGRQNLVSQFQDRGLRHFIEFGDDGIELRQRLDEEVDIADHRRPALVNGTNVTDARAMPGDHA